MFTGVELRLLYGSVSGVAKKANSINGWLTLCQNVLEWKDAGVYKSSTQARWV